MLKVTPIDVLKQNNNNEGIMPLNLEETEEVKQTSVRTAEQVTEDRRKQLEYKRGG